MSHIASFRLACLSLSMALVMLISPAMAETQKIGVVGALSGTVTGTGEDGAVRTLKTGDAVYLNESITSSTNSKAQIMFLDKSSLMINPDSKVMVDKFIFNPATSTGDLTIQNAKGALRFIGGALSKEKPVTIKTPVATIGIRGGIADTHVGANGATDAIFVYGEEMTMTNANGQSSSVTTPGQGLGIATANGIPTQLPPERVMQHLQSFSSGDSGDMDSSSDASTNDSATQDSNGDGQDSGNSDDGQNNDGDGDANADADDSGNTDSNDSGKADGDGKQDGNGTSKGEQNKPGDGKKPDAAGAPNKGDKASQQPNAKPTNGAANNAPNGGPKGPPPAGQKGGLLNAGGNGGMSAGPGTNAMMPTNVVNTNLVSGATQQNQQTQNLNNLIQLPTNPTQFGKYAISQSGSNTASSSGTVGFQTINGRQSGVATESGTGATHSMSLPWLTNGGYHASSTSDYILVDGRAYTGKGFMSDDLAMSYFQLQEVGGTQRIGTIFGRVAPISTWSTSAATSAALASSKSSTLTFYDFLPELDQFGNSSFGFFDYNVADSRLVPNTSSTQIGNLGMAVDWTNHRFITGHLIWENSPTTAISPLKREMILAFGKTNNGGRLLDGHIYEFGSRYTANGADQGLDAGFLRVVDAYSAANGAPFSGFIAEGILPTNDALDAGDATFNTGVAGEHGTQALAVNNHMTDPTSGTRTNHTAAGSNELKGYAAGFLITNTTPIGAATTRTFTRLASNTTSDVKISTNVADSTAAAFIQLENTANIVQDMYVNFGNLAGVSADSAFLTDDLYAAEQSYATYLGLSGVFANYSGNAVDNGALVSASLISDVDARCTSCEFVDWGVWAGEIDRSAAGFEIRDVASMIPYVAGEVTQNLNGITGFSNPTNVVYNGVMYGSVLDGSALTRTTGNFDAHINMNTRQLNSFNGNFAGMNFGFSGATHAIAVAGDAQFFNLSVAGTSSNGSVSGKINGALFGPQAQDIAGNFAVSDSVKDAAGVYLGSRQ